MQLSSRTQQNTGLAQIRELISDDFHAVNKLIERSLASDVVLINQLSHYIINSGGKRLRPLLTLLTAKACQYQGQEHIDIAAIIEFIHTATLLHDDVVDASQLRRGQETANAIWGNEASVLVGDFLYSRAFQMMVTVNRMRIMEILSEATNTIAQGEVMQLLCCHDPNTSEQQYLRVIYSKTAKLFEAGCRISALLADCSAPIEDGIANFGKHLGNAFQLVDDVLDYNGNAEEIGKNVGDDLAEGKPTLPLIYTMAQGSPDQAAVVREAIKTGGLSQIDAVLAAVRKSGALEYTQAKAQSECDKALACLTLLPSSDYTDAMAAIARFSVNRNF